MSMILHSGLSYSILDYGKQQRQIQTLPHSKKEWQLYVRS